MNLTKISKYLSLILRHKPEEAGITLDQNGWANVKELIYGVRKKYKEFDIELLEEIVRTDEKGRYSFDKTKTKIRANQGHSVNVDVELKEATPPDILYHGTATKSLNGIYRFGLKPMSRLYVHLSRDLETAKKVGERHGKVVVFSIDCKRMVEDGYKFFLSENGVWLTKEVPLDYLVGITLGEE